MVRHHLPKLFLTSPEELLGNHPQVRNPLQQPGVAGVFAIFLELLQAEVESFVEGLPVCSHKVFHLSRPRVQQPLDELVVLLRCFRLVAGLVFPVEVNGPHRGRLQPLEVLRLHAFDPLAVIQRDGDQVDISSRLHWVRQPQQLIDVSDVSHLDLTLSPICRLVAHRRSYRARLSAPIGSSGLALVGVIPLVVFNPILRLLPGDVLLLRGGELRRANSSQRPVRREGWQLKPHERLQNPASDDQRDRTDRCQGGRREAPSPSRRTLAAGLASHGHTPSRHGTGHGRAQ
mmetsp:Transcript_29460/g.62739  ORF Transcript_29460/g.62739 Transcript_29460/m.62739 type:complete len:288 (+) Transcript_29460:607-1470(+)